MSFRMGLEYIKDNPSESINVIDDRPKVKEFTMKTWILSVWLTLFNSFNFLLFDFKFGVLV